MKERAFRQINRRCGAISERAIESINMLASKQLDELDNALFDLPSAADVENWLQKQA